MNAFRSRHFLAAATITASLCSSVVAIKPAQANIDKRQAYNQIENGQIQSVKSRLQEELRKNPANLQAANDLAVVLIAENQPDAARGVLESALLAHPGASDAFKNLRELAARQYADAYAKAMGTQSKRKDEPIRGAQLESQQVKRAIALADAKAQEASRQAKL
ncbi:MAG: tetratricopeptide repeat protein, partial [Burkholderiaceae bacterium]